jgi:hypothetical protein
LAPKRKSAVKREAAFAPRSPFPYDKVLFDNQIVINAIICETCEERRRHG